MDSLLECFRQWISPVLIGDSMWADILSCAETLPISMGAQPFGFELPLHLPAPVADFGVTLERGTQGANIFQTRAQSNQTDGSARSIDRLVRQLDARKSSLRDVVGNKLMLEFDVGSSEFCIHSHPGIFLRPDQHPIIGFTNRLDDVCMVADSLFSSVGWTMGNAQRQILSQAYRTLPDDVRMDSFGVFPSRSRALRVAVMGFESRQDICNYLEELDWQGRPSAVDSVIARFQERLHIARAGLNIDIEDKGLGSTLGLTLIVRQRYTNDPRYWLDSVTDWDSFLNALALEELVVPEKLQALAGWVTKPKVLFAQTGQFILLRGIHHVKLVIVGDQLIGVKAYVFIVLSATASN